jgi:putative DNA primase/helicase
MVAQVATDLPNTQPRPLYQIEELNRNRRQPLFIVSTEREATLLTLLKLSATTWEGDLDETDFSPLLNRLVIYWPHNDEASFKMGQRLQEIALRHTSFFFTVYIEPLRLREGASCIHWVDAWLKERNIEWHDLNAQRYQTALRIELGHLAILSAVNRPMQLRSCFDLYREYDYGARPLPFAQEDTPELVEAEIISDEPDEEEGLAEGVPSTTPPKLPTIAAQATRQVPDDEAAVLRLSSMSEVEYLEKRSREAGRLGVHVTALEEVVQSLRASVDTSSIYPSVVPWFKPVDGDDLITELVDTIHRHVICDDHTAIAAAGWILHSWFIEVVNTSPIGLITAATKRCGKTTLLELFTMLTRRPLALSNISTAGLVRTLNADHPTLLIDEVDAFLARNEELRGVLNAGNTRVTAFIVRAGKAPDELMRLSTWGAKVLAGIGDLHETLMDRSIRLQLRRMLPTESTQRLRDVDPRGFKILASRIARWTRDSMDAMRTARPSYPAGLNSRQQDCWESLLAIADCAQGDWPTKMREAAVSLSERDEHRVIGGSEELMEGIQAAFEGTRQDRISTRELLSFLCEDEYAPWQTYDKGRWMTPRQLAVMLSAYGIAPQTIRTQMGTIKGYYRSQFDDLFGRYVGPLVKASSTHA